MECPLKKKKVPCEPPQKRVGETIYKPNGIDLDPKRVHPKSPHWKKIKKKKKNSTRFVGKNLAVWENEKHSPGGGGGYYVVVR